VHEVDSKCCSNYLPVDFILVIEMKNVSWGNSSDVQSSWMSNCILPQVLPGGLAATTRSDSLGNSERVSVVPKELYTNHLLKPHEVNRAAGVQLNMNLNSYTATSKVNMVKK